jgi:G3E family GTPase
LSIKGSNERYILQGVHANFDIQPSGFHWSDPLPEPTQGVPKHNHHHNHEHEHTEEDHSCCTPAHQPNKGSENIRRNKFVFIGRGLDAKWLQNSFIEKCIV